MNKVKLVEILENAALEKSLETDSGALLFEMSISPEIAKSILDLLNVDNIRKLDTAYAKQLSGDMGSSNGWNFNYDPIMFESETFVCLNGQHRLSAVVNSGKEQRFIVAIDVPTSAKMGTDIGKLRSISVSHGITTDMASMVAVVLHLRNATLKISRSEKLGEYAKNTPIYEQVNDLCRPRPKMRNASVAGAFALAAQSVAHSVQVFDLLRDLSAFGSSFPMSAHMNKFLESNRATTGTQRADMALQLLQGIYKHTIGQVTSILRPTTNGLLFFCPSAKYRSVNPSRSLGHRRLLED